MHAESHERFVAALRERFPGYHVRVVGPSWLRGDERVANACRAQVTLRDVLVGPDSTGRRPRSTGCR